MLLEIAGVIGMGSLLGWTYADKSVMNEGKKISRIALNCGLTTMDDGKKSTIQCLRRTRKPWGMEYVYRIPLGLAFEDFQSKIRNIEDGLNARRGVWDITLDDLKNLKLAPDLLEQIAALLRGSGKRKRKEVLMEYDGTLIIRVYREPLPEKVPFTEEVFKACTGWKVFIGEAREGKIYHDFDKSPHIIVAGTTRYGKSVCLKAITTTLIVNHPTTARIHLIDLKGGLAFNRFKNVKQVVGVAKDVDESLAMLKKIHQDMVDKQKDFLEKGYEDITEANSPYRDFIIVDEAAELSSSGQVKSDMGKKMLECERILAEIARIGGGLGYRLIYATQYPTADILPRQIKQNATAKLCFLLDTEMASRVVLDESGAESLPFIKGRGIYRTDRKRVVQSPFIENQFIDTQIKPHINIRPMKEDKKPYEPKKRTESGLDTIVIENA